MAVIALALWGLHAALNLVLRASRQRRRSGRSGLIGVTGRLGSAEWLAGVGEAVAIGLGVAAPILTLDGPLEPLEPLDAVPLRWAGLPIAAVGIVGVAVSQEAMGSAWRIGVDQEQRTELVTGGPFAHVRNPIYTFFFLVQGGIALLVPNALALAGFLVLILAIQVQVRAVEEPWLLRAHGERYARYAGRVGRFLPGVGRLDR